MPSVSRFRRTPGLAHFDINQPIAANQRIPALIPPQDSPFPCVFSKAATGLILFLDFLYGVGRRPSAAALRWSARMPNRQARHSFKNRCHPFVYWRQCPSFFRPQFLFPSPVPAHRIRGLVPRTQVWGSPRKPLAPDVGSRSRLWCGLGGCSALLVRLLVRRLSATMHRHLWIWVRRSIGFLAFVF